MKLGTVIVAVFFGGNFSLFVDRTTLEFFWFYRAEKDAYKSAATTPIAF